MRVQLLTHWQDLEPLRSSWDELARGVAFRGWDWANAWWREFSGIAPLVGRSPQLFVLGVFDDHRLVGLAPWYRVPGTLHRRLLRFLASDPADSVCSDHLGLLCQAGSEHAIAEAIANWLSLPAQRAEWDLVELLGVDADDLATNQFAEAVAARGCLVDRRTADGTWCIDLPDSWEEFLAQLSKSHRKQIRRAERRYFESGQATVELVRTPDQLGTALRTLVDLHQRRRASRGETGCFETAPFRRFFEQLSAEFLDQERLQMVVLKVSGQPAAVEFQIRGEGVLFAFQSGMAPEMGKHNPGHLAQITTLRTAIEQGFAKFDFLRGDEPYKAHWRATKRPSVDLRIVPGRVAARFRHTVWAAAVEAKQFVKRGLRLASPAAKASAPEAATTRTNFAD